MSFYGFNETRNVVGEVTATAGDAYSMKLHSPDDDIQGCELSNLAPVSSSLGNVIAMSGCGLISPDARARRSVRARIMRLPPAGR